MFVFAMTLGLWGDMLTPIVPSSVARGAFLFTGDVPHGRFGDRRSERVESPWRVACAE